MSEIDEFLRVCQQAVRSAGAMVQEWIGKTSVRHKGPSDLVTEADFASQEVIRAAVLGAFPDHRFLGEEDSEKPEKPRDCVAGAGHALLGEKDPAYRWITDPLDGTTNYVHHVPHYCVSLALEHRGDVLVGAVYDPCQDECFSAARGQGAYLNQSRMHTSDVADLSDALAATGFPAQVTPKAPDLLVFNEAVFRCQGVRRTGSAALNLCYMAAGRFDVLWAFSTKVWDVAAGSLLVQEAGGVLTAPDGGPFILDHARYIAAANAALYPAVREMIRRALG
ncbi:MAG: inositol monophosphatase family protein [Thermoguttaceae bacterium]